MKARSSGKTSEERLSMAATHWAMIPLVAGILLGMSFSTIFLLQPQTAITNIYLELPAEREEAATSRLGDLRRMLNDLGVAHGSSGAAKLSDEISIKTPVYYAVVMNHRHSAEQLKVLRDTWTRGIPRQRIGYYIPLEDEHAGQAAEEQWEDVHYGEIQSNETDPVNIIELPNTHSDFHMAVISHVCRTKLNDTKWFMLAGDDVYVKPNTLEAHLLQYDNTPSFGYLGRSTGSASRECLKRPGIILSHSILSDLCHRIDSCGDITGPEEGGGNVGRCITKNPGHSCKRLDLEGEEHFLLFDADVIQGSVTEKNNARKLAAAWTLSPISDAMMMYNIHQAVVSGQLNTTQHEMHSLKWTLDRLTELLPHSDRSLKSSYREGVGVESIQDIVSWELVNHERLLSEEEYTPTRTVPGVWQAELDAMIDHAVQYLNVKDETQHLYKRIVNAYWRVDPLVAIHYIIDFESSKPGQADAKAANQMNRHRITFTRSLNSPEISHPQPPVTARVTVIVCLTSEHTERLQQFMRRLETVLERDQRVSLVAVLMKSTSEKKKPRKTQNTIDAKSIFSLYRTKYPSASFTLLESPALLSRSHAIAIVLRESRPSEILVLADLDLEFNNGFLERCRNLPLQGQQIYFPVVFSQASPSLLASLNHTLMEDSVSQHSGHWLVDSYDVACVYAADLIASSTHSELKGMLNEVDMEDVYRVLLEKGYEVMRAPDKQLQRVHRDDRTCDLDLIGFTQDESCKVKGGSQEVEYLQTQLSALLFDHEGENSENKY